MLRDPVAEWKELSALYEQAELLEGRELENLFESLQTESKHLVTRLKGMLAARKSAASQGFLETLPRLPETAENFLERWSEGSRVGAYRLLRHIGSGGMAEVWLAERADGAFTRQVAIKLLFRYTLSHEVDTFARRFARERDILASLHHPNIAGLHDAGVTADGQPWLALEYVEGSSIVDWCDAQQMGVRDRLELFKQVLMAVQHAHSNLVIHRDLKPANILVNKDGHVWLLDFGIAKLLEPEGGALEDSELTRQAGRPLTLQYASPEQILGQPLTTACDVYSLGVVLYELLCGQRPYDLDWPSAAQVEHAILNVEPREPSRRNFSTQAAAARGTTPRVLMKSLSHELDAIVAKCLSKQHGNRYSSVEALRTDLGLWLQGKPVAAKPTTRYQRAWKFFLRHRSAVLTTAASSLALLTLAVVAIVMGSKAKEESLRAGAAREFLVEMFRVADPDRSQGAEPTARHILERASDRAVVDLKDQPELLAAVLDIVSKMQVNMGLFTVAETTLARLAALYERIGKRHELAATQVDRAFNAYQLGDDARSAVLVAEAAKAAATFPDDQVLQARLVLAKGWIARSAGKLVEAREEMSKAMAQSALAFGPNHMQTIEAIRGLAEVEGELRNDEGSLRLLADALARSETDASSDARYRLEVAIARANALLRAGRFDEGAAIAKSLMPTCERISGARNYDCVYLRRLWAVALQRTEAPEAALPLIDELLAASADSSAPVLQAASLITVVRALAENGRLSSRPNVRQQLADYAQASSHPLVYRVQALLTLAEVELLSASYDAAEDLSKEAIALLDANRAEVRQRGRAMVTLALSMAGRGQHGKALTLLQQAEPVLEREYGADHSLRFFYGLNRAAILVRSGRAQEAMELVDKALPTMRVSFGTRSPVTQRLEELRSGWRQPDGVVSESARFADVFL